MNTENIQTSHLFENNINGKEYIQKKQQIIEYVTTAFYNEMQNLDKPEKIRKLGGALFADFRYNTVFIYHNGAESYYAARGFRGILRV